MLSHVVRSNPTGSTIFDKASRVIGHFRLPHWYKGKRCEVEVTVTRLLNGILPGVIPDSAYYLRILGFTNSQITTTIGAEQYMTCTVVESQGNDHV